MLVITIYSKSPLISLSTSKHLSQFHQLILSGELRISFLNFKRPQSNVDQAAHFNEKQTFRGYTCELFVTFHLVLLFT